MFRNGILCALVLTAGSIVMLTLVACGRNEEVLVETPSASTPVVNTPTSTPDTQVQDTFRMSLDEYLAFCGGTESEVVAFEEYISLREFSAALGNFTAQMESMDPPAEVADWHDAVLAYQRALKKLLDDAPEPGDSESEDEYIFEVLFPLALEYQPPIDQAISALDPEVRSRLIAAGCMDEETTGSIPTEVEREEIPMGGNGAVPLVEPNGIDYFLFQAEKGKKYLIEVVWEDLPSIFVSIIEPPPVNSILSYHKENSPILLRWTAPFTGTFHIDVFWGDATGTFTVFFSVDTRPDTPTNVQAGWEGSAIKLSWEPVDEAEFYNVYHDDFFETSCSLHADGNPRLCDELTTNLVDTIYIHDSPDTDRNYYWVSACNQGGCSLLDSDNPALPLGAGGPTSGGPCQEGTTLELGEFCTVIIPDVQVEDALFEVRDGSGCYGSICNSDSINLNGFLAYANTDGSWLITRLTDGDSSREGATPVPTPTLPATTRAIPTPTSSPTQPSAPAAIPTPMSTPAQPSAPAAIPTPMSTPAQPSAPAAIPTPISTPTQIATAIPTPVDAAPSAPATVRYALEGSAIRVTWDAVDEAGYYNVYHDDFWDSGCFVEIDGNPRFCKELATNVTGTNYLHTAPALGSNYYWVVACHSGGCSEVETENRARPVVAKPGTPSNVTFVWEGSTIRVSWDPDSGADFYKVYHDDFFDSSCALGIDGSPSFCDELAANVTASSYVHTDPDEDRNYYWVVACNRGGCSDVDSENPARSIGTSIKTTSPSTTNADRATLVSLYNDMGGGNWRTDRSWLSDKPVDTWYGVTADRSGRITGLDLGGNELSGEIPEELGSLSNLVELDLSRNQLSGEITGELGSLSNLIWLDLTDNKMT